ncbi:hypothetical protein ANABIO32_03360 [Rossellomorea marisflavi]|nr:hypothetical protein ANABIO32_03360 [Rossellomorea marisflavi]
MEGRTHLTPTLTSPSWKSSMTYPEDREKNPGIKTHSPHIINYTKYMIQGRLKDGPLIYSN